MTREPDDWPEPWRHDGSRAADPTSSLLGRGQRVKVLNGRDRHAGQTGVVRRVRFDAGELLVSVAFTDGTTADYWENELLRRKVDL